MLAYFSNFFQKIFSDTFPKSFLHYFPNFIYHRLSIMKRWIHILNFFNIFFIKFTRIIMYNFKSIMRPSTIKINILVFLDPYLNLSIWLLIKFSNITLPVILNWLENTSVVMVKTQSREVVLILSISIFMREYLL